jgi:hypothetical protein
VAIHPRAALPARVLADLDRFLEARAAAAGPLTITFATADFAPLLANWLAHAARAGERAPLVVALDHALVNPLPRAETSTIRHVFTGSLADLWLQRVLFFEYLARRGIDFIHADVDAIWLKDPRPLCFADAGLDLVFSQGTHYPPDIWTLWGFVLCCGLFAARGTPAAADFFSQVGAATARVGDDQVAVNHVLAEGGLTWDIAGLSADTLSFRGRNFTAWRRMVTGVSERLGLRVGMLPHHLAPRLPDTAPNAYVLHPVGPGNPKEKAALLRELGCWIETQ